MQRAVEFLTTHPSAGLPLAPGGRKTSITLAAFCKLRELEKAHTMLVIAPLRVCRQTWPAEVDKWTEFRHLKVALLHGSKKEEALKSDADLYLINPEGVEWLSRKFFGRNLPFDIVCIDELTKFKNSASVRSKALRPRIAGTRYRWGLTGSLKPNTHMDLFGQQLMLDGGEALGRYITHFRDAYFIRSYNGFDYDLIAGSEQKIAAKLAKTWFYMDPADYSQLPPLVDNIISLEFDKTSQKRYTDMRNRMLSELTGGVQVTASNMAAAYAKMSQLANGAIYSDDKSEVIRVHDIKLDRLEELLDELDGQPLLLAYEFNHDIDRIRERFSARLPGGVLPYLGKGTTAAQETQWITAWNRNELPLLCAHPASAGHGLNLQEGNAKHVAWFSVPWDWELYDQFIRRIRRSGNEAQTIFNHLFVMRGTIDEEKLAAQVEKEFSQSRLLNVLNTEIMRDPARSRAVRDFTEANDPGDVSMVAKLQRPGQPAAPATQAAVWGTPPLVSQQPQPGAPPGGWVPPTGNSAPPPVGAGWGAPTAAPAPDDQRQRMQAMLTGEDPHAGQPNPAQQAAAAFSGGVADARAAVAQTDYDAPAPAAQAAGWGLPPGQPVAAHIPVTTDSGWGQPAAQAPQRERGKPMPGSGRTRRTKEEIAEDAAFDTANAPQSGQMLPIDPPTSTAPEASYADPTEPPVTYGAAVVNAKIMELKLEICKMLAETFVDDSDNLVTEAEKVWAFVSAV